MDVGFNQSEAQILLCSRFALHNKTNIIVQPPPPPAFVKGGGSTLSKLMKMGGV